MSTTELGTPYYKAYVNDDTRMLEAVTLFNERYQFLTLVFAGYELPEAVRPGPGHRVEYVSGVICQAHELNKVFADWFKSLDDLARSFELVEILFPERFQKRVVPGKLLDLTLTPLSLLAALEAGAPARDIGPAVRYWWTRDGEFQEQKLADLILLAHKYGVELSSDYKELWIANGHRKLTAAGELLYSETAIPALEDEDDSADEDC